MRVRIPAADETEFLVFITKHLEKYDNIYFIRTYPGYVVVNDFRSFTAEEKTNGHWIPFRTKPMDK